MEGLPSAGRRSSIRQWRAQSGGLRSSFPLDRVIGGLSFQLDVLLSALSFLLLPFPLHAQSRTFNAALDRAATSFNAGKLDQAEKLINAADKISPKHPEVPNMRGAIYLKQKKYDEAEHKQGE